MAKEFKMDEFARLQRSVTQKINHLHARLDRLEALMLPTELEGKSLNPKSQKEKIVYDPKAEERQATIRTIIQILPPNYVDEKTGMHSLENIQALCPFKVSMADVLAVYRDMGVVNEVE